MYRSPSALSEQARVAVSAALFGVLADSLDLHSQVKVAHWNVKGPQFAALHPLFDQLAQGLALRGDELAERAVTLGAVVRASSRHVASASRLPEWPGDATRDLELVALLAERFERYLDGLRRARAVAEEHDDTDTVDLLTGIVTEFEKHAWFLHATLAS